jgi:arylsulfatase A
MSVTRRSAQSTRTTTEPILFRGSTSTMRPACPHDFGTRQLTTMNFKLLLPLLCLCTLSVQADEQRQEPNVIFVLADDLGIGDLEPTNPDCQIKTPHLKTMASEGITFLDAHSSSAVCTPTRYGVLTGRYNWRSRLARGVLSGTSDHLIPAERATVAHLLRKAGYHTQMIGKWHLGWDWAKVANENGKGKKIDFTQPVMNGPDINGFDGYYAHCGSLDMPPYVWVDTGKATAIPQREEGVTREQDPYGWYRKGPISPDFKIDDVLPHLFQKSMDHVKERAAESKGGKPFFLYLALPAPHTPIVPVPPFKDASGINPYADFVMQVDHHMGELLDTLKASGIDDNTLVFFTSDNGCSPQGNFEVLKEHGHDPSAGYRGHKADIYEGGHRVPFIVRWPSQIKAGQTTRAMACLTDLYGTVRDITGQPAEDRGGEDSFSLVPAFNGEAKTRRETLISHSIGGSFAIRQGNWKLCLSAGSGGWSAPREPDAWKQNLPPLQLFDLKGDRGERKNLHAEHPERVASLLRQLKQEVSQGRSTSGSPVSNDRDVTFLPKGVSLPERE